jgi:hypothetical protein
MSKDKEQQIRAGRYITTMQDLSEALGNKARVWLSRRRNRGIGKYAVSNEFARQAVKKNAVRRG